MALAGPRWGRGDDPGISRGRDLIVAFDLSRSMLAADMHSSDFPQRWQAGKEALRRLSRELESRGGHRLGLVVFAARPALICPPTTDYDYFRQSLDDLDPDSPPPEVLPAANEQVISGTRIGAGVAEAVRQADERYPGFRDILLISDGHDPVEDGEYQLGIEAAIAAKIPVHVVGVGRPNPAGNALDDATIIRGRGVLFDTAGRGTIAGNCATNSGRVRASPARDSRSRGMVSAFD